MSPSVWTSAASTAVFGSIPIPTLSSWTPASFYNGCQLYLKSLILALPLLFFINAPFGRFGIADSPLRLPGRLAFALMEIPAPIILILALASSNQLTNENVHQAKGFFESILQPSWSHLKQLPIANVILGSLYVIHYTHRAVLQPIFGPKRSPSHVLVFLSAFIFQSCNGFTMGSWLGGRSPALLIPTNLLTAKAVLKAASPIKSASWFASILPKTNTATLSPTSTVLPLDHPGLLPPGASTLLHPTFLIGVTGWAIFFLANAYHDEILFNLRRPAKRGDGPAQGTRANVNKEVDTKEVQTGAPRYEIPEGGLYSFISYPNYFTECECCL
jgi:3-oxo-5-alpha-steroid 4-dehydrogenase 1